MRRLITLITMLPALAYAEPLDRGFVGGHLLLGADHFLHLAAGAEAGAHLGSDIPLWAVVSGDAGTAFDFEGGGSFLRFSLGLELHQCAGPGACLVLGGFVGGERSTWTSNDVGDAAEDHHGLVLGGRVGIDTGGDRVRFRGAIELVRVGDASGTSSNGANVTLGVAARL